LTNSPNRTAEGWKRTNVQYRQAPGFHARQHAQTRQEAEKLLAEKYGWDHIVVEASELPSNLLCPVSNPDWPLLPAQGWVPETPERKRLTAKPSRATFSRPATCE
jgi:hypothetical protein